MEAIIANERRSVLGESFLSIPGSNPQLWSRRSCLKCVSLASRELSCACLVAVHGAVLAVLEPRGTLPQPPAAFSHLPPAVLHSKDQIRLRYSLQGHRGCLGYQIQL